MPLSLGPQEVRFPKSNSLILKNVDKKVVLQEAERNTKWKLTIMADEDHLRILRLAPEVWNLWRLYYPQIKPDLREADLGEMYLKGTYLRWADLSGANLSKTDLKLADLIGANLSGAHLNETNLRWAKLYGANLRNAYLVGADLRKAFLEYANMEGANLERVNLSGAKLSRAKLLGAKLIKTKLEGAKLNRVDLRRADLSGEDLKEADLWRSDLRFSDLRGAVLSRANLRGADLEGANLERAILDGTDLVNARLNEANLDQATLTNSRVYGISTWRLEGTPRDQRNLIITRKNEPVVTLDNLEIAQFIYLLLNSPKMRDVINTITTKMVLILGRFVPERKAVLNAIQDELRRMGYLPMLFDWDKPPGRTLVETISTLAHMSRFIIADITNAKSIPAELEHIVPTLPSVAVMPIMLESDCEYALFDHISAFKSVLDVYLYETPEMLLSNLKECVIDPAEKKAKELIPPARVKPIA